MKIKQLSIFVENKAGRLAKITKTLADAKIDIRAISVADTTEFGILRLIVNDPERACAHLKNESITVSLTEVIAIDIDDTPGEFARAMDILSENNIAIEYVYAFVSRDRGKASVILRVDDSDKALEAFAKTGIDVLSSDQIRGM